VPRALKAFERERRPVVEKIIAAANASSNWYERLPDKMMLEPWQLAYDYRTRSGRMTDKRLRELSPEFMVRVDAERKHAPYEPISAVKRLVMGRASLALSGLGGSTTDPAQIFDQKLIKRVCYS
jgi:hypothetical protein